MNTKIEGIFAIVAALIVLFSAMWKSACFGGCFRRYPDRLQYI
jgi:hypothetical protein